MTKLKEELQSGVAFFKSNQTFILKWITIISLIYIGLQALQINMMNNAFGDLSQVDAQDIPEDAISMAIMFLTITVSLNVMIDIVMVQLLKNHINGIKLNVLQAVASLNENKFEVFFVGLLIVFFSLIVEISNAIPSALIRLLLLFLWHRVIFDTTFKFKAITSAVGLAMNKIMDLLKYFILYLGLMLFVLLLQSMIFSMGAPLQIIIYGSILINKGLMVFALIVTTNLYLRYTNRAETL